MFLKKKDVLSEEHQLCLAHSTSTSTPTWKSSYVPLFKIAKTNTPVIFMITDPPPTSQGAMKYYPL